MKLNIVTAAANSVGQAILKKIANSEDITIWLSRKWCQISNVLDFRITDLIDKEITQKELLEILSKIDLSKIEKVNLYHNCCLAKYEFPQEYIKYIPEEYKDKVTCQDYDGDGIDDWAYYTLITTFKNVFSILHPLCKDKLISIGTVCSLTDKKRVYSENLWKYISPSIFHSMIESNWILRNEISSLVQNNKNIHSICVSAATVKTETEDKFRKYSLDKNYWVSGEMVADTLKRLMENFINTSIDEDVFVPHPDRDKLSNETDEQLTKRQLFDITNIKL
jgi:hypothetical protein